MIMIYQKNLIYIDTNSKAKIKKNVKSQQPSNIKTTIGYGLHQTTKTKLILLA